MRKRSLIQVNFEKAIDGEGILLFVAIGLLVLLVGGCALLFPVLNWLPSADDAISFLRVIWQVHASILAITVVIVTILITVIANDDYRSRTWSLYAKTTRFLPIVWFNLWAIITEGLASIGPVQKPLIASSKAGNLVLTEGVLLLTSLLLAARLFKVTFYFLKDENVEKISREDIIRAMPRALEEDLQRRQDLLNRLQGGASGH